MHEQAKHFMSWAKSVLGDYFINKRVLDVGSGDINGNNRFLFDGCLYEGNDVIAAKNVTIVSKTKDLQIEDGTLDTIVSTECFEHDPEYEQSFNKIYKMLKPGGLFCFTCASINRPEHGTARTNPTASSTWTRPIPAASTRPCSSIAASSPCWNPTPTRFP